MANIPFFPKLIPPVASQLWFDVGSLYDDESEIIKEETEFRANMDEIKNMGSDLSPIGKIPTESLDQESDEEDGQDESDESEDSHDEEDEIEEGDERREAFAVNYEVNELNDHL